MRTTLLLAKFVATVCACVFVAWVVCVVVMLVFD